MRLHCRKAGGCSTQMPTHRGDVAGDRDVGEGRLYPALEVDPRTLRTFGRVAQKGCLSGVESHGRKDLSGSQRVERYGREDQSASQSPHWRPRRCSPWVSATPTARCVGPTPGPLPCSWSSRRWWPRTTPHQTRSCASTSTRWVDEDEWGIGLEWNGGGGTVSRSDTGCLDNLRPNTRLVTIRGKIRRPNIHYQAPKPL